MNNTYSKESIKQFVENLYEDGRTHSDRFGLSHEDLGKLEQELFDRVDVIDLVDCGFVQGMSEEEILQHFLESQEFVKKVKQFNQLQDNMNTAIDKIESMSQEEFYNACVKAGYTPTKRGG